MGWRAENTGGTGSHRKLTYKNGRGISDVAELFFQLKAELNQSCRTGDKARQHRAKWSNAISRMILKLQ